jgi:hypothetical protein
MPLPSPKFILKKTNSLPPGVSFAGPSFDSFSRVASDPVNGSAANGVSRNNTRR